MKFSYQFYSKLSPEQIPSCLLAHFNQKSAVRWPDLWSKKPIPSVRWSVLWSKKPTPSVISLWKKTAYTPPISDYYGKPGDIHFEIELNGFKSSIPESWITGDIFPHEQGSIIQVTLEANLSFVLNTGILLWSILVGILFTISQGYISTNSTNSEISGFIFWGAVFIPAMAIWEIKCNIMELKKFFSAVSGEVNSAIPTK